MKAKGSFDFCSFFTSTGTEGKASIGRRWGEAHKEATSSFDFSSHAVAVGDGQHEKEMVESHKEARSIFDFSSHAVTVG